MSKELIVSATRHETRVAVLEDDQVVEIFHQREKEYSLAGSIHKGRVTRVLPGMQSAFVDIGLERDAFLYVSDFFEDNDEYDKIVTTVEEKVLRLEKEGGAQPAVEMNGLAEPLAMSLEAAAPERMIAAPERSAVAPERKEDRPERTGGDRNGGDRSGGDRNRDDRGGRGGRGRRRGRRPNPGQTSGGLPESKYFSPRSRPEEAHSSSSEPLPEALYAREENSSSAADDLVVLPGESLAKYMGDAREIESPDVAWEASETEHPESDHERGAEPAHKEVEAPAVAHVEVAQHEATQHEAAQHEVAHGAESEPLHAHPHRHESASEEPVEMLSHPEEPLRRAGEPEPEAPSEVFMVVEVETSTAGEVLLVSQGTGAAELLVLELEAGSEAADDEEPDAEETEGPEPARIPTSLTATLREQGPRFQHRVSRRTRRKGRGGADARTDQSGARTDQPAPREVRSPDARPEGTREPRLDTRFESRSESRPEAREEGRAARPPLPSISDLLHEGQEIVVQIAKEPLGQKGARITSHVALPGRFLVYMPSVDHVGVSRKIPSDEERLRLKKVLQTHRVGIPGGFIVRTAGDGRSEEELRADMMFLYSLWTDMRQNAEKKPAPQLMHHDLDVVQRILRDQLTAAFKTVWVDNEELYESILGFVQRFQPAMVSRVKLYTRTAPIFDEFGVTAELEKALKPKVWLKSGGYIVINQTEALVAIDINTGKYVGKSNRLEDTIVKTNTDAIKEIVRQIRLRDLGGIIVVDFIDMDERKNRQKVMQALEEAMRLDRAPYKILQFNDFGLVAITRKRVKQSLERTLCSPCPYCEGAGSVKSVQTVIGEILVEAHKMAKYVEHENVMLRVNPEVGKVLKSNQNDFLQEIEEAIGKVVMVKSDPQLHQTKFDLA